MEAGSPAASHCINLGHPARGGTTVQGGVESPDDEGMPAHAQEDSASGYRKGSVQGKHP